VGGGALACAPPEVGVGHPPGRQRLAPALWNLFSNAGRRVGIVGWWATWPAEQVRGTIVSDALAPQLARQNIRMDAGIIAPESAATRVKALVVRADGLSRDDLAAYVPLTEAEFNSIRASRSGTAKTESPLARLAESVAATRTYSGIAEDLARTDRPDLLAVYLESIDTVSHLFVRDARRGRQAIDRAYIDSDALVLRVARASPPQSLVFVCSDHGFYPPTAAIEEDPANLAGPATAWHRPYGIVGVSTAGELATGQPSRVFGEKADVGSITPLDVAPTLLHAAGLPVSSDMPGRVIKTLLPADIAMRPPVRALPPKFTPPALNGLVRADADEARDRLRALGYVGAVTSSLARQNLAESLFRRGKYPAAERELRAVLEAQPQNVAAQLWLAQTLVKTGRSRDALVVYERAIPLPGGAKDALIEATDLAIASGDLAAARRMIGSAPAGSYVHVARGALAEAQHDLSTAQREYRLALEKEPTSFDAVARLSDLLTRAGRSREALDVAERANRLAPDSPRLLGLAGNTRLAAGDAAGAERALRRALELAPDADALRLALGRALFAAHKTAQTIDVVGQARTSPDRDILLGAAYSSSRDWRRAIEHLQQALDAGRATPEVLNALGWAQMQSGDRRAAEASFNRSLAAKPDQPEIRRLLMEVRGSREDRQ